MRSRAIALRYLEDERQLRGRALKAFPPKHVNPRWPRSRNPGSHEAHQDGCTCSMVENHFGRGYGDPPRFIIEPTCPMHGDGAA